MPYKFKRWRIRWQKDTKKFKKIKRDRQKSRKSYVNWRKNKSKMLSALRKSKAKRKLAMKKNKARGMYKKLAIARKRWKNILKSDTNLDNVFDGRLFLEQYMYESEGPTIDIEKSDIEGIITILKSIYTNHEWDDKDDQKTAKEFVSSSIKRLETLKDVKELFNSDEDFLQELLDFINEYGEDIGAFKDVEDWEE